MVDIIETDEQRMRRPDPDPTNATMALVDNRIASVMQLIKVREEVNQTRFLAMDKAVELLQKFPTAIDVSVGNLEKLHDQRMDALHALIIANDVENHNYRDIIAEQTRKNSTDVDAAVKAAFAASTLAVTQQNIANALASDKQGAAFTKDIEKLTVSLAQIQKSSDDKLEEVRKTNDQRVNDLKERMSQMEARSSVLDPTTASTLAAINGALGSLQTRSDRGEGGTQSNDRYTGLIFGVVASLAAIALVVVDLVHK